MLVYLNKKLNGNSVKKYRSIKFNVLFKYDYRKLL